MPTRIKAPNKEKPTLPVKNKEALTTQPYTPAVKNPLTFGK